MLVDSSVWIELLRSGQGEEVHLLSEALRTRRFVAMAPLVLQETLQGATSPAIFRRWRRAFEELPLLLVSNPGDTHVRAAQLYMRCRLAGITPRSANDCLIAVTAIEFDLPILHRDLDFVRIATVEPSLKLIEPARRV
jgi:predicted nucleic acid-binding protein